MKVVLARKLIAFALMIPLIFVGGAVGASAATRHATKHTVYPGSFVISFATFQGTEFLPLELAKDDGIFAKYGLNPTVEVVQAAALPAALESGAIQISVDAAPQLEFSYQEGVPIKLLAYWGEHENTIFTARPEITSFAQLAGKPIGGSAPTSLSTILLKYELIVHGVHLSQITIIPTNSQTAVGTLVSGGINAAAYSVVELRQAQAELPGTHVLFSYLHLTWPCCEVWGYVPWITSHHAETVAVMKALNAAVVKWNADPTLAGQEISKYQDVSNAGTIAQAYTGTQQIFNHGAVPLHIPSTKLESFINKALRLTGFPSAYNSYAAKGKVWTPTFWDDAFAKS